MNQADVLIVGAGLSGLAAAQIMSQRGLKMMVIDKGRSVGGRLATRRIGQGVADHGAQFFTVRSAIFQGHVNQWQENGLVYVWSKGFSDGQRAPQEYDGHARYATRGGMNMLAKHIQTELGERIDLRLNTRLTQLEAEEHGWLAQDEQGQSYTARAVLLTAPVPQSLNILGAMVEQLAPDDRASLQRIAYSPCVCGLFGVEGEVMLPDPGALQRPQEAISWIADNQRKGISPNARVMTLHASPAFSQQLYDIPEHEALTTLQDALRPYLGAGARITQAELKKWRYAQPTVLHPQRYLLASQLPPLAFAGDAFGEARVEGAFLSGLEAGEALLNHV